MAALTDYFENQWIDWFFRAQALAIVGATASAPARVEPLTMRFNITPKVT